MDEEEANALRWNSMYEAVEQQIEILSRMHVEIAEERDVLVNALRFPTNLTDNVEDGPAFLYAMCTLLHELDQPGFAKIVEEKADKERAALAAVKENK